MSLRKPYLLWILSAALGGLVYGLLFYSAPVYSDQPTTTQPYASVTFHSMPFELGGETFYLEIATTPEQVQRGLMFRKKLASDEGMLFRFNPAQPVSFWMKNCKISLDMIFINQGQVIKVLHNVPPCKLKSPLASCPLYNSDFPVDAVIELAGGTAKSKHIELGENLSVLE